MGFKDTVKVCLKKNPKKLPELTSTPGYDHDCTGHNDSVDDYDTEDPEEGHTAFLGTLHSSKTQAKHIHGVFKYWKRIYANVTLNDKYIMKITVD